METKENDPWGVTGQEGAQKEAQKQESAPQTTQAVVTSAKNTTRAPSDDLGTASMVFGIISLFLGGNIWGIIGLVLGCISASRHKNDHATAGIICSAISIAGWIIAIVALVVIFVVAWPTIKSSLSSLTY